MSRYAANTDVSAEKSRGEIERILMRYGADQFAYGFETGRGAMVQFRADARLIRFVINLPDPQDKEFWYTPARRQRRSQAAAEAAWEQATRQRWRALSLVIKAKLEAVEAGISEFEQEFLANIVLPDGTTVGDWMGPQVAAAYDSGQMPSALPQLPAGEQ